MNSLNTRFGKELSEEIMHGTILVVDDENGIRWALKHKLAKGGHAVITAENGEEGLKLLDAGVDLALVDVKMPGMDGYSFIREARRLRPSLTCIAMSGCGTVDSAARARKMGAADFVEKPFRLEELENVIQRLLRNRSQLAGKLPTILESIDDAACAMHEAIIGKSPKMKEIYAIIRKLQRSSTSTVLIGGESGTGKELVARAIHVTSERRDKRFTEINCAALTETLLEAELFGYEKGAFTGAVVTGKVGLFEATDGGTIFLDEIGEMGLNLQAKLLRVLQEKSFRKVGGIETIDVDVRVIASTNRNLDELVREGKFREDLFYRLNVVPIEVPPLRERKDDVMMIAEYYLNHYNRQFGTSITGFSEETEQVFREYSWPGNVRELKNVIERAVLMESGNVIGTKHLMLKKTQPSCDTNANHAAGEDRSLASVEREHISRVLNETLWQRSEAARVLGIHRTTLATKIKEYDLEAQALQNAAR